MRQKFHIGKTGLRTVPIPAGTSVRANKYDSFLIRNLRQIGFNLNPRLGMSAKTMQEINSRTRRSFLSQCRIRSDYYSLISLFMEGLFTNNVSTLAAKEDAAPTNKRAINRSFFFFIVFIICLDPIILHLLPKVEIRRQVSQKSDDTAGKYIPNDCPPEAPLPAWKVQLRQQHAVCVLFSIRI